MKIISSQFRLQSTHRQFKSYERRQELQLWEDDRFEPNRREQRLLRQSRGPLALALFGSGRAGSASAPASVTSMGPGGLPLAASTSTPLAATPAAMTAEPPPRSPSASIVPLKESAPCSGECAAELPSITGDAELDGELLVFALVIARLTGRPVYLSRLGAQLSGRMNEAAERCANLHRVSQALEGERRARTPEREATRAPAFRYEEESRWSEYEQLEFSADGEVRTADGQRIKLSLDLNLERSYLSEELRVVERSPLKDPLIFDLGATAARFTGERVSFDIDADGSLDALPTLDESGAFLTLDKNGDGEINDGGELIGAISGDGFGELRALDDDESGWIDEGDEVFDRLSLWSWDSEGRPRLLGLAEVGVGAIYLGAIDASFEHRNAAQERVAQQRAASLYLRSSGEAGTIRQVDVAG